MIMINILLLKNLISDAQNFTARLEQANLGSKSDIAHFVKKTYLNKNELNKNQKMLKQY